MDTDAKGRNHTLLSLEPQRTILQVVQQKLFVPPAFGILAA
jgi:hypothetical protein